MDSYTPYYGPGSVSMALPTLLETLVTSKALVVTGNSLYTKVCLVKPPSFALTSVLSYHADRCREEGGRHPA
jgi:hypothetical protein